MNSPKPFDILRYILELKSIQTVGGYLSDIKPNKNQKSVDIIVSIPLDTADANKIEALVDDLKLFTLVKNTTSVPISTNSTSNQNNCDPKRDLYNGSITRENNGSMITKNFMESLKSNNINNSYCMSYNSVIQNKNETPSTDSELISPSYFDQSIDLSLSPKNQVSLPGNMLFSQINNNNDLHQKNSTQEPQFPLTNNIVNSGFGLNLTQVPLSNNVTQNMDRFPYIYVNDPMLNHKTYPMQQFITSNYDQSNKEVEDKGIFDLIKTIPQYESNKTIDLGQNQFTTPSLFQEKLTREIMENYSKDKNDVNSSANSKSMNNNNNNFHISKPRQTAKELSTFSFFSQVSDKQSPQIIREIFPKFRKGVTMRLISDFALSIIGAFETKITDFDYTDKKFSCCQLDETNKKKYITFCVRMSKLCNILEVVLLRFMLPEYMLPENRQHDGIILLIFEECLKVIKSYNMYTNSFTYTASVDIPRELKISVTSEAEKLDNFGAPVKLKRASMNLIPGVRLFSVLYKTAIKPEEMVQSIINMFQKILKHWDFCEQTGCKKRGITCEEKDNLSSAHKYLLGFSM